MKLYYSEIYALYSVVALCITQLKKKLANCSLIATSREAEISPYWTHRW
jgi:hypothetical protein